MTYPGEPAGTHPRRPSPILQVTGLRAGYGAVRVLDGIDLSVAPGERLVVLGASGSGKSTLLRVIAGLEPQEAGCILVHGKEVTQAPAESRRIVYLHQHPVLFPHLDVARNVAFPLRVRRVREPLLGQEVQRALAAVRLEGMGARRPATLSGGQKHRVALARAIAARPHVLLLDEPLSALDPALRQELRDAIVSIQAEDQPGMILVTHDLEDATLLGDRIGLLLNGRLAQVDSAPVLFQRPSSLEIARFLGLGSEIEGVAGEDTLHLPGIDASLPLLRTIPSGPVTVVVPRDALRPDPDGRIEGTVLRIVYRADRPSVRVGVGRETLEAHVSRDWRGEPGSAVRLSLDPDRVHVFSD